MAGERDVPGTYQASYQPLVVQGDLAIAEGTTRHFKSERRDDLDRAYYNVFVVRFEDGRCREFTDWYMEAPRRQDADHLRTGLPALVPTVLFSGR